MNLCTCFACHSYIKYYFYSTQGYSLSVSVCIKDSILATIEGVLLSFLAD